MTAKLQVLLAASCLVLSTHAAGLRCRKYRWNAGEARYVCDGNDNELSHSEDGVVYPNLSYLGEGMNDLGVCQGRCHKDSDCAGDLVCIARDPTLPSVEGCAGGENLKFMNYCYYQDPDQRPPEGAAQQNVATAELGGNLVYVGEPPFTQQKLQECQGDCDSDWNCEFGYNCFKRSDDRAVPGCNGVGIYSVDYCYRPGPNELVLVMDAASNMIGQTAAKCEGSCLSDADCDEGLQCFERSNYQPVPGCRGIGAHATNYCYDPSDTAPLTDDPRVDDGNGIVGGGFGGAQQPTFGSPVAPVFSVLTTIPTAAPVVTQQNEVLSPPTDAPTVTASQSPSVTASQNPTVTRSAVPSASPTGYPTTATPSSRPSLRPATAAPTAGPSSNPSMTPTEAPSLVPTVTESAVPSSLPSIVPTMVASDTPSTSPSGVPTVMASSVPSVLPSTNPTVVESDAPSVTPSSIPTVTPSDVPSTSPSSIPSNTPTSTPTVLMVEQAGGEGRIDVPTASPTGVNLNGLVQGAIDNLGDDDNDEIDPSDLPVDPTLMPSPLKTLVPGSTPKPSAKVDDAVPTFNLPDISIPSSTQAPTASGLPPVFFLPEELIPSILMQSDAPTPADGLPPTFSLPNPDGSAPTEIAPSVGDPTDDDGDRDIPGSNPLVTPSEVATDTPSDIPSLSPSLRPSTIPSDIPSSAPSLAPSSIPSDMPSRTPSGLPSVVPSDIPSTAPSVIPSQEPSDVPSLSPSISLSSAPSDLPSTTPSVKPSQEPSDVPSLSPSISLSSVPSDIPSTTPSQSPSIAFTLPPVLALPAIPIPPSTGSFGGGGDPLVGPTPSDNSAQGSDIPTSGSTDFVGIPTDETIAGGEGRDVGTEIPSDLPSMSPSSVPSSVPSDLPSLSPSGTPTSMPSDIPSIAPTVVPSPNTVKIPTDAPILGNMVIVGEVDTSDMPSSSPSTPTMVETATPTSVSFQTGSGNRAPTESPVAITEGIDRDFTVVPSSVPIDGTLGSSGEGQTLVPSPFPAPSTIQTDSPTHVAFQTGGGDGTQSPVVGTEETGRDFTFVPSSVPVNVTSGSSGESQTLAPSSVPVEEVVEPSTEDVSICANITDDQRTMEILNSVSVAMSNSAIEITNRMPFQQAFQWLIDDDLYRICPGSQNMEQRYSLAVLYFSLGGWNASSIAFLNEEDECDWDGVKCNAEGFVEGIELDDFNLTGILPDLSLMSSSLKELDLDSNKLEGPLPSWLTKLTHLEILDLDTNMLSGTVPQDISSLTALRVLDLDANSIGGSIPEAIGDLTNLYFFQVDFNSLTGVIPPSLAAVDSLEYLSAFGNEFSEPLALEFCSRNRTISLFANCELCTIAECCAACLDV